MTITMYGADWCGDCRRAKAWFAENGVPYRYVDLVEVPEATDVVLERNNGTQNIPVIVFNDDTHLTEPSNADLAAKVDELGSSTHRVVEQRPETEGAGGRGRFELWSGAEVLSFASFTEIDGVVTVPHVETAPVHRGNGHAARLMDGLLGLLRSSGRTIVPVCPFAADHIRAEERHRDLLAR